MSDVTAHPSIHAGRPHLFRHTATCHLLESGVEVNVIRSWLRHVSLDTTNRYAELTLRACEVSGSRISTVPDHVLPGRTTKTSSTGSTRCSALCVLSPAAHLRNTGSNPLPAT
ncbi:tyrosine-type recombinase/integrase [Mesorhizobium sp. BHbsci]